MKIGILTYHRSLNYGALLQATAMYQIFTKLGHDVFFVDYWPEYHKRFYALFDWEYIRIASLPRGLRYLGGRLLTYCKNKKNIEAFKGFIEKYIVPHTVKVESNFDCIVYGSDQIWRKQSKLGNKFNGAYFGTLFPAVKNHFSYAASMGDINLSDADKDQLYKWLGLFKTLGVRESDLKSALNDVGLKNVQLVLDPTLLLSEQDWRNILPIKEDKEKYVLVYNLQPEAFDEIVIKEFATARGLKVRYLRNSINKFRYSTEELIAQSPIDMVREIAYAQYVFTSSYHGLVFSIIFNRQFATSFTRGANRAQAILNKLGLEERLVKPGAKVFPNADIDYAKVNLLLEVEREESMRFILKSLSLCEDCM